MGANSGVITQRETKMYEQREDQETYLRVHSIPGIMDYINFEVSLKMKWISRRKKIVLKVFIDS